MEERGAGSVALGELSDRRLGAAIVGAGFIGAVHARSARLAGARLAGVATSTPERSREAAARLGAPAFDDAEALVTAPDVDVVHLCTPNHLHAPLAMSALAAGKHVVCEKPLALDAREAAALAEAADGAGSVATVPFVYRYHPTALEARARIAAGELGALRLLHGGYLQDWLSTRGGRLVAGRPAAGRRVARVRRHRLALVRSRRVRHRRADRRRLRAGRDRSARAGEPRLGARVRGVGGRQRPRPPPRRHRGSRHRDLPHGVGRARERCSSARSRPAARTTCTSRWLVSWRASASSRSARRRCGSGAASAPRCCGATRPISARPPPATRSCRLGTRRAISTASTLSWPTPTPRSPASAPDGLPRFADGLRTAQLTDAVMASAATGGWLDV